MATLGSRRWWAGEGRTKAYAAPEVLLGSEVSTAASDAYSFGLVVYEALARVEGMPTANEREGKEGDPPWLVDAGLVEPDGEAWGDQVVRALSYEAGERPMVKEWGEVLEAVGAAAK